MSLSSRRWRGILVNYGGCPANRRADLTDDLLPASTEPEGNPDLHRWLAGGPARRGALWRRFLGRRWRTRWAGDRMSVVVLRSHEHVRGRPRPLARRPTPPRRQPRWHLPRVDCARQRPPGREAERSRSRRRREPAFRLPQSEDPPGVLPADLVERLLGQPKGLEVAQVASEGLEASRVAVRRAGSVVGGK
jgi:hypothetical protein